jgi:hypothetical protein
MCNRSGVFRRGAQKSIGVHYDPFKSEWLVVGYVNRKRRPVGYYKFRHEAEEALERLDAYWKKYT